MSTNAELAERILRLEVKHESVERRLGECGTQMKWVLGLLGSITIFLAITVIKDGAS